MLRQDLGCLLLFQRNDLEVKLPVARLSIIPSISLDGASTLPESHT
jgi:hypothetical protein